MPVQERVIDKRIERNRQEADRLDEIMNRLRPIHPHPAKVEEVRHGKTKTSRRHARR
jgi:hypothetical protein